MLQVALKLVVLTDESGIINNAGKSTNGEFNAFAEWLDEMMTASQTNIWKKFRNSCKRMYAELSRGRTLHKWTWLTDSEQHAHSTVILLYDGKVVLPRHSSNG